MDVGMFRNATLPSLYKQSGLIISSYFFQGDSSVDLL